MKINKKILCYIKDKFKDKKNTIVSTAASLLSILLSLISSQLYNFLTNTIDGIDTIPIKLFVIVIIFLGTIFLIYWISDKTERIKLYIWPDYLDDKYMQQALLKIKKLGANRQESFQESIQQSKKFGYVETTDEFMIQESLKNMQLVVQSCFDFFDSTFTKTGQLVNDIKFETTFMTRSYSDGEITIPCSANKENRTPISMIHRNKNNKIFENTETAKIYSMERPVMILVEDTSNNSYNYSETYSNQKDRIKSSVILPVLSHQNVLLGTLVVHCNQANFFKQDRHQFWNELLEIFSVELGYHKLILDFYISSNSSVAKPF